MFEALLIHQATRRMDELFSKMRPVLFYVSG